MTEEPLSQRKGAATSCVVDGFVSLVSAERRKARSLRISSFPHRTLRTGWASAGTPMGEAKSAPFIFPDFVAFCWKLWYCGNGAASNGRRLAPCGGSFLAPDFTEGGDPMVTYSDLFQFVIMITAIIALILQIAKKK